MSSKSQCHVQVKSQLPLHSAHEGLQNQHIPGSILREKGWGGTQRWCVALSASGEEQIGGEIMYTDWETASNMPFTLLTDTCSI